MWPPVRAKLADDPDGLALLDAMEDEHRLIDPLLAAADDALANGAGPGQLAAALARLRTGRLASPLPPPDPAAMNTTPTAPITHRCQARPSCWAPAGSRRRRHDLRPSEFDH